MPLSQLLEKHIIKSTERFSKSNIKVYCKACVKVLEEREEIFALSNSKGISNEKRPASPYNIVSNFSKSSSARKVIQDEEKFEILLLRLTISCGIPFHWINNPETKELFQFLNSLLKLLDCQVLSEQILKVAVSEKDKMMNKELCQDKIGITLTFDSWINIKAEQLLGIMRETYIEVMEKMKEIIHELQSMEIKVSAVVTDSADPYVATRQRLRLTERNLVFLPYFAHQLNLSVIFALNHQPQLVQTQRRVGENPTINCDIIDSGTLWTNLTTIAEILYPYSRHKPKSEEIQNENNTETEDFNEEETVESDSLGEFSQFLNVWVVILAEKTKELMSIEYEEDEEISSLSVGDIIHPAIDSNAKWDIITLFNELPLLFGTGARGVPYPV
ncbi:hypothetical protein C2G38_2159583 [Gigaspora rosea]|uniref:DUF659 domain-containing protein n=1 Tax=Gigaspora rosea TaxID=44941 RepID=A0A397W175_9GLOM|nr:hypothetical protein C2G38_2159583 [Gigaspora rosea]